jgi:tRNA pseudouridine38-40 synthase
MAYYKSIIAYDGTGFHGFQRQSTGIRTVQSEFEAALRRLNWEERSLKASGRTDAGAHARGQVVSYRLDWKRSPDLLTVALNSMLPDDLAVRGTCLAHRDFHPRRSATGRLYSYQLLLDALPDPILEKFAWRIWPSPDLERMRQAAGELVGIRDFGAFGSSPVEGGHTLRRVFGASFKEDRELLIFVIEANAFLYHMVRRVMGALIELGIGRLDHSVWKSMLERPENRWQGRLAPARGLFLERVLYDEAER